MKKLLFALLATFLLPVVSLAQGARVGDTAPGFTQPKLGGGQISLSEFSGKVVYLFFMGYN